ncbi:hypothetical protein EFA69_15770 [Rufibacter immobilis]|uniref:Glycosyltransferase family 61 protein n=1 Tax=Rufibacter immobilis TaxID=1348778 RepID=A0A3M9MPY9_9BACT|nr:hypothetical protein [Rufibacter immobilis]RNI27580.1 hypothetical protein EFA69_15770 [Rufibacter immobilis]
MQKIILKSLFVVASLKYPHIRKSYRYYIRDNYFCRINQVKYCLKDYFRKEKYKVTDFQGEFDQELRYVIPFAYWHFLNGTLLKTISCKNTRELYFFSHNHEERYQVRDWRVPTRYEFPNMEHSASFSYSKWRRVPYKQHFSNSIFVFEKPILIIANKYNMEWDNPPLNFLSIIDLDNIISTYGQKYQIIYNRPLPSHIVTDNSEILDLQEHAWLKQTHSEVILVDDLYETYRAKVNNFNHLQLLLYANCDRFISMHGGTAALASCFEGINVILSKGHSKEKELGEFATIFPALSGAKILHAQTTAALFEHLQKHF